MPVASFDVFDTLLTRTWAEPRDLFVALGRFLRNLGLTSRVDTEFAVLRRQAEHSARNRQASREIPLAAIYEELASLEGWSPTQRDRALQAEIDLEARGIRPVPGRLSDVQAARQRGCRVAFLSDMYLPSVVIRSWLEKAGLFLPGDLLLVSGEAGTGKGTGGLFRIAREQLSASPDWTHFGDNPRADDAAPRALGLRTVLDQRVHLTSRERLLRGEDRFAPEWRSRLAGAARLARLEAAPDLSSREQALWDLGAVVAGPLFFGYTRWCLEEAGRRGLHDLYFLARGGQVFFRIAELLSKPAGLRCHYLHTSRLAFSGAFDGDDPGRLRQLAAPSLAFHSVRQSLANLGLENTGLELPSRWPKESWDANLPPEERTALADWLLAPERLGLVQRALTDRAAKARAYLHGAGLQRGARAGLVDTGWMGTIQRNIEHLLGDASAAAPMHGFYLGLSPVREFTCAGEANGYTNRFHQLSLRRETTHLILLELMARGDHGPLLGFAREQDRVTPQHAPIDEAQRREVMLFQSAILAFVRHVSDADIPWPDHAALGRHVIENYLEFFHHPSAAEVGAIAGIQHSDQMLEQRHSTLCHPMTTGEVLRAITDFHRRPPGWWLAGQSRLGHAPILRAYMLVKRLKWALQTGFTGQHD